MNTVIIISFIPIHIPTKVPDCVVPENIQTPTTEGIGNSEGVGGSMAQEIPKGRGVSRPNSLPDGREND